MTSFAPSSLTKSQAQAVRAERARRALARRHVLDFTNFTLPHYAPDPVHGLIAATLDQVVAGQVKRSMIFAPPQHGKSELVSVRLPAFWLAHHPDLPVGLTSYAASLAEKHSQEARDLIESDEYARLFPGLRTRDDSRAKNFWRLAGQRGGLLAAGVGGPITGHGFGLGIVDDPFENWAQAQSLTVRNAVWDWWRGTFRTRIWEDGAIVFITTRWHEDDLAGRLLAEQASEWTVLRLPALAETQEERDENHRRMHLLLGQPDPLGRAPGEPLAPRRFGPEALRALRRDTGSIVWASEYQGAPRAPEGNRFKRHWFKIVDAAPATAARVRYWDKAGTEGGGKFTAGVLIARASGRYCVEDVERGQWSALEREARMQATAARDEARYGNTVHIWLEQEPGSGGKESAEASVRNLAGYSVHLDKVTGDKDVRLEPFAAQCEAGNVDLVRGAWNGAYLDELCAIPNGAFRDQSDASGGGFNKLPKALEGQLVY